jgi:hypothetical protein
MFLLNKSPSTKASGHQADRVDIFLRQWIEATKKARQRDRIWAAIPIAIPVAALALGYTLFGNAPGLIALVAAGVALSQALQAFGRR